MRRDPVAELEQARRARPGARVAERALEAAGAFVPRDATGLARLHDAALFLRAYPQSPRVLDLADGKFFVCQNGVSHSAVLL